MEYRVTLKHHIASGQEPHRSSWPNLRLLPRLSSMCMPETEVQEAVGLIENKNLGAQGQQWGMYSGRVQGMQEVQGAYHAGSI